MPPGGVAVNSVKFEIESWTDAQRAFAVKSFYKNNDSYVAVRREFHKKFGIHRNSKMPSAHAIKTSVNNFEETGSTVKKKGGSVKTVRTPPQNIDAVRASFVKSPRRSAVRHSKKLGLSETTSHNSRTEAVGIGRDFKNTGRRVTEAHEYCSRSACWVWTA